MSHVVSILTLNINLFIVHTLLTVSKGFSGVDKLFVNPDLGLKPSTAKALFS